MLSKVMTATELSEYLGISYSHFRTLLNRDASKLPPYFLVGDHKRWYEAEVERWIKETTKKKQIGSVSDSLPKNAQTTTNG